MSPGPQRWGGRLGLFQICLTGLLWGTIGLAVQLIREREPLSVLTISAWRLGIAALVLGLVLVARRALPALVALVRARPRRVLVVGSATAAFQGLYFAAVTLAGVTVATVIALGLGPLLLTTADAVRARRLPGRGTVVTVATALVGLILVSASAGAGVTGPEPVAGSLLGAASGAAYALATGAAAGLARMTDPLTLTTATMTVAAAILVPAGLLFGGGLGPSDPAVLGLLAWLGVGTMALAYGLLYAGLRTTSGSAAVVATLLEPAAAAVLAAAVLGERVGMAGIAGTALILAAVAGLARRPKLPPGRIRPGDGWAEDGLPRQ